MNESEKTRIEPASRVKFSQLIPSEFRQSPARAVRGSLKRRVVQNDELPVFGRADIQLEAQAEFQTTGEGRQRVFRCVPEQYPVTDEDRIVSMKAAQWQQDQENEKAIHSGNASLSKGVNKE